ncbi:ZNRF3 ligase, partial [Polypterus senegalus]|nr:ZNRF3 ligase [Polypterus senegalus]
MNAGVKVTTELNKRKTRNPPGQYAPIGAEQSLWALLLLAAAAAALAKDTAFVEVVLFESSPSGDYTTYTTGLQGRFSRAGATISAEGEIVQVSSYKFSQLSLQIARQTADNWSKLSCLSVG